MENHQQCLHQMFHHQAKRSPGAIAVVDGDHSVTYRELDYLTDCLAGYLQAHGVTLDNPVGIFMETCYEYVVSYIAILKAGGAYMPLDLAYPDRLLGKIFSEAEPKVIVTKAEYVDRLDGSFAGTALSIDADQSWKDQACDPDAVADITLDNLAFLAYTSGTTGEPKGVLQTHRSAVNSYLTRYELSTYGPDDRVACNIFFVWELLRPLLKGAACYIIPDEVIYDPRLLTEFIARHKITEVLFTPSLLETTINSVDPGLVESQFSSLNVIWLNGEVVTAKLKHRAFEVLPSRVRLLNTYSISECHDVSDVDLKDEEDLSSGFCTVGRPRDNVKLRLLDKDGRPVPSGTAGELYIGGPCLARGYLNKPELTAERFVWIDEDRYYRTGDLAELLPDGRVEIKGRCDDMVKIRGYSIHLGAVETALLEYAHVRSCAVIADGSEGEDKRLVAYMVRNEEADWEISEVSGISIDVRRILDARLPHYMIPSTFVELDEIPLNPVTGKLNRKALPEPPKRGRRDTGDITIPPTASQEEQEEGMRALWERILFLDQGTINNESDFFDYGGHSLLAVELTIAIDGVFGVGVLVKDVYEHPSVSGLVKYMIGGPEEFGGWDSIRADAQLDPAIAPPAGNTPVVLGDAASILVTGTTGFLGAFLLEELIRATDDGVDVYCLVREESGSRKAALDRIVYNLDGYGLFQPGMEKRIVPVVGDLAAARFGLTFDQFAELAEKIDLIFHCAALVNYIYPYSVIKPSTVGGTQEIIRFACTSTTKPIHYVSSNGIFPNNRHGLYPETGDIDTFADELKDGYGQAKWVSEKLIWEAISRGLPACLYRPGNIGFHSVSGKGNPRDLQSMIIDACSKVGYAPSDVNWRFEMTPVDTLVKAIVRFAAAPSHYGRVYNIVQQDTVPVRTVFDLLLDMNLISGYTPVAQWKSRLDTRANETGDFVLSLLAQSLGDVESQLSNPGRFDCSNFDSASSECGLSRPSVDVEYLKKGVVGQVRDESTAPVAPAAETVTALAGDGSGAGSA